MLAVVRLVTFLTHHWFPSLLVLVWLAESLAAVAYTVVLDGLGLFVAALFRSPRGR